MKNSHAKSLLVVLLLFVFFSLWAERINTAGTWDGKGKRTFLPAEPIATISSNVLSIYFTDVITDLYICVTDSDNNIIYADYISAPSRNYTYGNITLPLILGETYQLQMSHITYGCLIGTFIY